ncbi:Cacna1c [Symbiodinium sp. CCMP2456]|nr:Cacna1c [Symbiodinium sp. CCMP2456]
MAALPDEFAELIDSSWITFRQQLLAAHQGREAVPARSLLLASDASPALSPKLKPLRDLQKTQYEAKPAVAPLELGSSEDGQSGVSSLALNEEDEEKDSLSPLPSPHASGVAQSMPRAVSSGSGVSEERHGDVTKLLNSDLKHLPAQDAQQIRQRLRLRLGCTAKNKLVSGKDLMDAVSSLGLTRYTEDDMNDLVNAMGTFINLRLPEDPEASLGVRPSSPRKSNRQTLFGFGTSSSGEGRQKPTRDQQPVWEWPAQWPDKATASNANSSRPMASINFSETLNRADCELNMVPLQVLTEIFLAHEGEIHKRIFGARLLNQFRAVKEILLAGDTNRLVAELTFVRINDLAAPPEPIHPLMYLEPFVAVLIVLNGIMIGFQTDPSFEDYGDVFFYLELVFALFIWMEIFLRIHLLKCAAYWCGPERYWNYFDQFLAATGVADISLQIASDGQTDIAGASLLRFCRLIRLVRIVKLFRVKFMKDLRLMVKGLLAGIRTLALAFALLFAVLYVISGFATITLGANPIDGEDGLHRYFANIPESMFTAFRCFTGECISDAGRPIQALLAEKFGLAFVLPYVACYMLVSMGIFNVILAVYVDITMRAAKENEAVTAEQHSRESIRIARVTRELLKKFASAHHQFQEDDRATVASRPRLEINHTSFFTDDEINETMEISKELFMLVIQDYSVQSLMDDLDLPPDRANLFEVIDADGSGTLKLTELVQGLLKIRGEINKSDTVAALLAIKAVQSMVSEMKEESSSHLDSLKRDLERQVLALGERPQAMRFESKSKAREKPRDLRAEPDLSASARAQVSTEQFVKDEFALSLALPIPLRPEAVLADVEVQPPPLEVTVE